jgi:hypothetical protein
LTLFFVFTERPEDIGDATWSEVATACCVHDAHGWGVIFVGVCAALFFLYFFLLSLELLGSSTKVLGGCSAGGLMGDNVNPWQDWCWRVGYGFVPKLSTGHILSS